MPTVPIIDSVDLQTQTGRRRIQADDSAFGALEARAGQQLAQAVGHVGDKIAEVNEEMSVANARELDNQLSRRIRERLWNPETGYFSSEEGRGANAEANRAAVEAEIDAMAAEMAATARNDRARALFSDVGRRRVEQTLGDIAQHSSREAERYQDSVSEAAVSEAVDNMVAYADNPAQLELNRGSAIAEIYEMAERHGWDDELRAYRVRQFQSDANQRIIVRLAGTDPEAARAYYEGIAPTLTAEDSAQLEATMRGVERERAETLTDDAWVHVSEGRAIPAELWGQLPGRVRIQIQDYRRARAEQAASGGVSARESEAIGDRLELIGALNARALEVATDYAEGRISVGNNAMRRGRSGFDMSEADFERQTGMTPSVARELFARMNDDDRLRVLNRRRGGGSETAALDAAVGDVMDVARPMAEALDIGVSGTGRNTRQTRGAFEAFIYRETRRHIEATGEAPDADAREEIARRALLRARNNRYAFQSAPDGLAVVRYNDIPRPDRDAIEADLRRSGREVRPRDVERRYAEYLAGTQE